MTHRYEGDNFPLRENIVPHESQVREGEARAN